MPILDEICTSMAAIAPLKLAESWDNVGLLVGDRAVHISRVMTCLTVSPDLVDEAIANRVDLIVVHHPLPFKPISKITTDSVTGQMLWRLIGAKIAVYSAHTAFDSAAGGINQLWAQDLGLSSIEPLIPNEHVNASESMIVGAGRCGRLAKPMTLADLATRAAEICDSRSVEIVGSSDCRVAKVASACGSGGSFVSAAKRRGCDALVSGEATYHQAIEARSIGLGLILVGHFSSERFAMDRLAARLSDEFAELAVFTSKVESDPLSRPA